MCRPYSGTNNTRRIIFPSLYLDDVEKPLSPHPHTVSTDTSSSDSEIVHEDLQFYPSIDTSHCSSYYKNVHDYYHVKDILGTGTQGSVREGLIISSSKRVAIKSVKKGKHEDYLRQEISFLQIMDHPGIVKLVDVCEDNEYVHIITEQYSGGELFDKIAELDGRGMSEAEAARIIFSLLGAVAYLHKQDIVHRDIKPENIMFASTDECSPVKLIDLGLARTHNSHTDSPMCKPAGSVYYMSPEVLRRSYDRSCDLWSIGIVAYILLCGYPPFNGNNNDEIFDEILNGNLHFDPNMFCGVSEEAKDLIRCLLRRNPSKRPSAELALFHPWFLFQKSDTEIEYNSRC